MTSPTHLTTEPTTPAASFTPATWDLFALVARLEEAGVTPIGFHTIGTNADMPTVAVQVLRTHRRTIESMFGPPRSVDPGGRARHLWWTDPETGHELVMVP